MAEMMEDSMMVFAQITGQNVNDHFGNLPSRGPACSPRHHPEFVSVGWCHQGTEQAGWAGASQTRQGGFITPLKTLTQSVNDLRADFKSYESRPASELEDKCTASALEAVVAGINKVMQRQQKVAAQIPMTPLPPKLNYLCTTSRSSTERSTRQWTVKKLQL